MLKTMEFSTEALKLNVIMKNQELLEEIKNNSNEKSTPKKVLDIYDELFFPKAPEDRPYTFGSIVLSMDGKMAYEDDPQGPLIAANNLLDADGGLCDWWILNLLRAYADGAIIGAGTIKHENQISNCFDEDLVQERFKTLNKKEIAPANIVVSFDGTDVPLKHDLFEEESITKIIATSPHGGHLLSEKFPYAHYLLGPYPSKSEIDFDMIKESIKENEGKSLILLTGEENRPDTEILLYILRNIGYEKLVIESPTFMWHLMAEKAMDEMFINYSSVFAGGKISPGIHSSFLADNHPHCTYLTLATHKSNFIFTRQKLIYGLVNSNPVRDDRCPEF